MDAQRPESRRHRDIRNGVASPSISEILRLSEGRIRDFFQEMDQKRTLDSSRGGAGPSKEALDECAIGQTERSRTGKTNS